MDRLPGELEKMQQQETPFSVMRYIHNGVDNYPPDIKISEIVREWNNKWAYPKLIVGTNTMFFEELEKQCSDVRTFRGELPHTDYVVGALSTAKETTINRLSHDALARAEKLAAIASLAADLPYPADDIRRAYDESAPAAVLLAAMFIHGVRPGPLIMIEFPEFIYRVVAMVFLATCAMLILGLSLVKILVKVLTIPREKLMPFIFVLCAVGSYAIANRLFDVLVMVVFGIIGYYMRVMGYPVAPTVLGIILGDILDKNLRRGLILTDGDIIPFFTRPISLVIFLFTLFTILSRMRWFRNLLSAAKTGILHRVSDLGLTSKNMGRR